MPKFSKQLEEQTTNTPTNRSPIQTTTGRDQPTTVTNEGGAGWERTAKGELFLLAVTNMVSENAFYESGKQRDERFVQLVHQVAGEDPLWMRKFIPWLRNSANMRSASLVAAVEFGRVTVMNELEVTGSWRSQVVNDACQRADEPGEMLAYYWATNNGRRAQAQWLVRGLAMAAKRLYNERSVLKYDTPTHVIRMADVVNICHPSFDGENNPLFDYILHRRQGHKPFEQMEALPVVRERLRLEAMTTEQRTEWLEWLQTRTHGRSEELRNAGATWEWLSSWVPSGGMSARVWEAIIPSMGYMALLRNLRNFDQAGVSQETKEKIAAKLADPTEVAKSRQFPFRFLSAYKAVDNDFWRWPLGQALDYSLRNIPQHSGRTLILVDDSGSMYQNYSAKSSMHFHEQAKLFGVALGLRCEQVDAYQYSTKEGYYGGDLSVDARRIPLHRGASVLNVVSGLPQLGNGTPTFDALRQTYNGHDRVVILTDEQAFPVGNTYPTYSSKYRAQYGTDPAAGINCPIYTFNLAGYKQAHLASGSNRYSFGGLTDAAFQVLGALETRRTAGWPWEV